MGQKGVARSCELLLNFGTPPLYFRNSQSYKLEIWCADRLQWVLFKNA